MFAQDYLNMFNSTIIKYMDEDKIFAYSPFTNRDEQMNISVCDRKGKVIVFDTRTSYINATQLINSFKTSPTKEFSQLSKTKTFKEIVEYVENEINKDPHPDKKFLKYPNYDNKGKYFKAMYSIRPSVKNVGYAGTYVHPDLIIHVLVWCNHKLSSQISKLITSILLHEGANEMVSLNAEIENKMKALSTSLEKKKEYIKALESKNEELIEQIDSNEFDIIQYQKTIDYLSDLREENNMLRKALNTSSLMAAQNQAVLVVANYDDEKYKYVLTCVVLKLDSP